MTQARSIQISLADTPYYHCIARCVRRAFLCGVDEFSGHNYEHRRQWIVDKLKALSSLFAIDICAYAVMSNHYHVVLRVDATAQAAWSQAEVIERWTQLFSAPVLLQRYLRGEATTAAEVTEVGELVEQWRERLADISWFMRCLNESIARRANKEDNCKGRFWEGRFRSQALLDDSAVLACMAYVDLNPIRVGLAECPESSDFTSIQARLRRYAEALKAQTANSADPFIEQPPDLLPFVGGEHVDAPDGITFALPDYLQLVDWTGRGVREDKRCAMPADLQPIFQRLGLNESQWLDTVQHFGRRYRLAAGAAERLQAMGQRLGRCWMQGVGFSRRAYRQNAVPG
jgi:REP element-mobilizing transposase RayT